MEQYCVHNQQLADYVKNYSVLDFSDLPREGAGVRVPPMGFPVLQFHFGDAANFYRHKNFTSQSVFIGQCSRHIMLFPSPGVKLIGVNFKPYGLYNLLGIAPHAFQNSGVESAVFFGNENVESITCTLREGGVDAGISGIEDLLLRYKNTQITAHPHFDSVVDLFEKENGLVNYAEYLGKNISRRTFQRYFKEVIGISPKLFCQLLRHKYIMELLYKNPEMKWSDLQLNGFYYDFAHFTKDFSLFAGLSPKQYLPLKNSFASALMALV